MPISKTFTLTSTSNVLLYLSSPSYAFREFKGFQILLHYFEGVRTLIFCIPKKKITSYNKKAHLPIRVNGNTHHVVRYVNVYNVQKTKPT